MKTPRTKSYNASGGKSELRSYDAGEGATIELHEGGSVFVGWSTRIHAADFMVQMKLLLDEMPAQTQLAPALNGRRTIPFTEAQDAVDQTPERFNFIAIDTPDDSFTWEAVDPAAKASQYPEAPGEVGIVFSAFKQSIVQALIESTATPHVQDDVSGILSSAQRLTSHTSPASA